MYVASAQRPEQHERPVAQARDDAEERATLAVRGLAHCIVWDAYCVEGREAREREG